MAVVHGDPESIRELARLIESFAEHTRGGLERIRGVLDAIGSSDWHDAQYALFVSTFEETVAPIRRAIERLDPEQVVFLKDLAEHLEAYGTR